jgi:Tfp pilus assembly PilM family ATPase
MSMDTETFSYSYDEETFRGKYATRQEAINAAGKNSYDGCLSEGTTIWIGRNEKPPHARDVMISADDLIEQVQERVGEDYGECSQEFLDLTAEQKAEVQRRLDDLADYIQSIDPPEFYLIEDVQPFVVPEA